MRLHVMLISSLLLSNTLLLSEESLSMSASDTAMYQEMLENNPAEIFMADGEMYFDETLGGEVEFAKYLGIKTDTLNSYIAGFPRYIDTLKAVVSLDQVLQAFQENKKLKAFSLKSEKMKNLLTYVKSMANEEKITIDIKANKEILSMHSLGEEVFNQKRGGRGLSCLSCHSQSSIGSRLRMQILPDLGNVSTKSAATWPAYRMTKSSLTTLQRRFQQCMKNALLAPLPLGSKEMVALEVYITNKAKGQTINIPGLKR